MKYFVSKLLVKPSVMSCLLKALSRWMNGILWYQILHQQPKIQTSTIPSFYYFGKIPRKSRHSANSEEVSYYLLIPKLHIYSQHLRSLKKITLKTFVGTRGECFPAVDTIPTKSPVRSLKSVPAGVSFCPSWCQIQPAGLRQNLKSVGACDASESPYRPQSNSRFRKGC